MGSVLGPGNVCPAKHSGFDPTHAPVTRSGTATSNIAWFCVEAGDAPKTTANCIPSWLASTVCELPVFKKSPVAFAVKRLARPLALDVIFSVVMTAGFSVPLLFNTVSGNENLATVWPLVNVWATRNKSS